MAALVAFDAKLAAESALAQGLAIQEALIALVTVHPQPQRLLELYEVLLADQDSYQLFSSLPDEAHDYANALRRNMLQTLRERVSRCNRKRASDI